MKVQPDEAVVIDARGLSCPQPVILMRKALDAGKFPVEVLVDSAASRDNVARAAENESCTVSIEQGENDIKVIIST